MTSQRRLILGGLIVLAICVVIGVGSFYATKTLKQVPKNTQSIEDVEDDRRQREAAACTDRHADYLAKTEIINLIDSLLHQTDINDPRIPANLRALALENRAKSEVAIAEARRLATATDCPTAGLP